MSSSHDKLVPFTYDQYPLGSVRPLGWIEREIQLSAKGLGGHLFYFYRFVHRSTWLGGTWEYTALNEAAPYWYNYIVPLAYSIDKSSAPEVRARILTQAQHFLRYTLEHQAEDGWLGPESTKQTRGIWARCLLLQGLINHAQADKSRYDEILQAMIRFVRLVHGMLSDNLQGYLPDDGDVFDPQWFGVVRAHELSLSLQWLYDRIELDEDRRRTWEVMEMLWDGAKRVDREWTNFFTERRFPNIPPVRHGAERATKMQHGVNVAQGLRYPAQQYRMHPSESLRRQPSEALSMVMKAHGTASGSFTSDEYIGGLSPQRGVEVCCTVELMFSLAYLYQLLDDGRFVDQLEMAAFNAFPAGISEDWWSHQYITQINQPWACELLPKDGERVPFYDVCRYANVYGLEPEFPCCTVNHPAAFPKLSMNTFLRWYGDNDRSEDVVQHAVLVAGELDLADRRIKCETAFPFDPLVLNYTITSSTTFKLAVRIPDWCKRQPTVIFAEGVAIGNVDDSVPGQIRVDIPASRDYRFQIFLHAEVNVHVRDDGTVNIYRGPLLYAYPIPSHQSSRPPRNYKDQISDCTEVEECSEHVWMRNVQDHDLLPAGSWGIAFDISRPIKVVEKPLKMPASPDISVWSSSTQTTYLEVAAREIKWPVENGTAMDPGKLDADALVKGPQFVARLVPYACAKLHIAQFPVLRHRNGWRFHKPFYVETL